MKIKLNLRDAIASQVASRKCLLLAHAEIDLDDLFETNELDEEVEVDVRQLLRQKHQIAEVWDILDVQSQRPHLTDEQAWEVLQTVEFRLNPDFGINWDFIRATADELHPKPPTCNWNGRIDVRIMDVDHRSSQAVLERLRVMAESLARDIPDVEAAVDETALAATDET